MLEIASTEDAMQTWKLTQCPRRFVADIVDAVNLAQLAEAHLPITGGVMEQCSWWVDLWMTLKSDINQVEADKAERERARWRI